VADARDSGLPDAWRQRFAFYHAYGLPGSSPQARDAYKALPFGTKIRITSNLFAFFFGSLYFVVKGMWRKGISLLAATLVVIAPMELLGVPGLWINTVVFGFAGLEMAAANYAYYLHVVKGSRSWNPLEGFGRRPANA
jgi:uncharacterized protein DUF2628